jgi:hypothetical protein
VFVLLSFGAIVQRTHFRSGCQLERKVGDSGRRCVSQAHCQLLRRESTAHSLAYGFDLCVQFARRDSGFQCVECRNEIVGRTDFDGCLALSQFYYFCTVSDLNAELAVFGGEPPCTNALGTFDIATFAGFSILDRPETCRLERLSFLLCFREFRLLPDFRDQAITASKCSACSHNSPVVCMCRRGCVPPDRRSRKESSRFLFEQYRRACFLVSRASVARFRAYFGP